MESLPTETVRVNLISDAIRNQFALILGSALIGVLLAGLVAVKLPDSYTSSVDIMLSPTTGNALAPDSARSGDQINVAMQTEAGLISSPAVAELVGEAIGSIVEPGDPNVSAAVPSNTQIIRVAYSADTVADAVKLSDAYARAFLEYRSNRTKSSITSQLDVLKEQEEAAAEGLRTAGSAAQDGDSPEAIGLVQLYTNRLSAIQEKIGTLEATPSMPGSVISPASPATASDGLPTALLIIAGLGLGLGVGGVLAIWRERSDDRIRASIEGWVNDQQVMGVVGAGAFQSMSVKTEAYRTVRTALLASAAPPSTIVISAVDDTLADDAQRVALGTASALATSGYRTCLIDASLTNGVISSEVGDRAGIGFSGALRASSASGIVPLTVDGFDVVDGGTVTEATREQYGSAGVQTVLTEISRGYDYVLLATPDMGAPEASELALATDGVVLVVAERRTTRSAIRRVTRRAQQLGIGFVGVIAVELAGRRGRGRRRAGGSAERSKLREIGASESEASQDLGQDE